ncbi:MAG: cache domain-containing protein [Thermodesulfobacteriota bacterium]|nr:cache domain-containing protein [Thermodesulfobacteriota bacterium]
MRKRLPFILLVFCMFFVSTLSLSAAADDVERNKEIAHTIVNSTATGLGAVLKDIKAEKDRLDLIRSFIDPIRFYPDKSGYFYVYDYHCVNTAHATQKDLVGKNLYDYQDCKGKFVIRELAEAARKGGGFVEYFWVKPGLEGEHRKIGYVEPIPHTEYFIGTGVYLPK